jgi:hypothetical protein
MTARRRILWISSLAPWVVAALVWGVVQVSTSPGGAEPDGRAQAPVERPKAGALPARQAAAEVPDWTAILARLDRRRERAYAANDPAGLRAVYVAGSTVLRHDLAILRAYGERGARLTGVRLRLLDVALLDRSGSYARLRVVDRLDRPVAHTAQGSVRLPRDRATERLIVLRDAADGWRIEAVRPA